MNNKEKELTARLAIKLLKKYFNIKFEIGIDKKTNEIWCRYISIQGKEEEGTYDTTAQAELTNNKEEFEDLKYIIEREEQ